ncbi:MAG: hypothetical protein PHO83_11850 [Geobacteraceae bacterium]|nr:hypothetical protein [Geobacteraceae bacterium]
MLYFLAAIFALILAEAVLCATWSPLYFRYGIPLYRRTLTVRPGIEYLPTARQFHAALPDSGRSAPIVVQQIGANSFAFRENLLHFGLSLTTVVRGVINYDAVAGKIDVRGYTNWSTLALSCYVITLSLTSTRSSFDLVVPVFFVGLMLLFWQQKKRFRQVDAAVQKLSEQQNSVADEPSGRGTGSQRD